MKSGLVAIIGRPNVGKSTLLNAFLGQKIVITTPRPQTTRNRILGILTHLQAEEPEGIPEDFQIVFHDTPGVHKARDPINRFMMEEVRRAVADVDLVLVMVDLADGIGKGDQFIMDWMRDEGIAAFLVLNKTDLVPVQKAKTTLDEMATREEFKGVFVVSALKHMGTQALLEAVVRELPEGPLYYEGDIVTDRPERFIVAELVREQIFQQFQEEVPYSTAVTVEEMKERPNDKVFIRAVITVERNTQKAVIIGKGGVAIKNIGQNARREIREALGMDVYLELFVRVRKNWRKDERALKELGYE